MPQQRPSLGRVVWFYPFGRDAGRGTPLLAHVTHVYDRTEVGLLDLAVLGRDSLQFRMCIPHRDAIQGDTLSFWDWPERTDEPSPADSSAGR